MRSDLLKLLDKKTALVSLLFIVIFLMLVSSGCVTFKNNSNKYVGNLNLSRNVTEEKIVECRTETDCDYDKICINNKCNKIDCRYGSIVNHICKEDNCLTNIDCRNDEICENKKCERLTCKLNTVAFNHECVYKIFTNKKEYITPFNTRVSEKVDRLTNNKYDAENFGNNLKEIYYYSTSINYRSDTAKWGVGDYWQTADQTIEDGTGDCEDNAILLESMIEYLLYKTYGKISNETSYVVIGCVDLNGDGISDGCHAWNIIDASKLPKSAYTLSIVDPQKNIVSESLDVIVDDVTVNESILPLPKKVRYEISKDIEKNPGFITIYWQDRKWVELESTWKMPLSYYENKGYPYVQVFTVFNSQESYYYPNFVRKDKKPTILEDMLAYLFVFLKITYNKIINLF